MSKKILFILTSTLSISSTVTPQSPPPYIYPGAIIVSKPSKPTKPYQYLLNAIKDGSFSQFRNAMKEYYTNKAQLPEINTDPLSKKPYLPCIIRFP